jgi:flagellar protein FliJ
MAKKPKKSKRFIYNLQSVLNFRELRETQEQEKFNIAERKYKEELEKEEKMKEQELQERIGLTSEIEAGKLIDFQQVLMRKAHLDQLKVKVLEQIEVRQTAEEEKNIQHEALIQAMKDRKILEEDKKKKRQMWVDLMKKEEVKFLDELASIGYVRQTREEEAEQQRLVAKREA